jgi:hypothetical protein
MTRNHLLPALLAATLLACGGAGPHDGVQPNACGSGSTRCGTLAASLAALNSGQAAATFRAAPAAATSDGPPAWLAGSILSGPPDELRITVHRVVARDASGGVVLFEAADAAGVDLPLTSGTASLAALLGVDLLTLPAGHYTGLELELGRVARIRGCVTGTFMSSAAVTGTLSPEMIAAAPRHAGNVYSNDPITDGQPHTFCTSAARSELAAPTFSTDLIGSNADFEAQATAELTEIDLAPGNGDGASPDAIRGQTLSIQTLKPFDVAAGGTTPVTLAVDLNRTLRYFANTRSDLQPPNPAMKAGTSYFFATTFTWSTVLIAGDGLDFQGYQLTVVQHRSDGGTAVVPTWLTLALSGGAVASGLVIPDDDNDLTLAKGSLDPAACTETAPGVWTLGYALGMDASRVTGSFDGFTLVGLGASTTSGLTPFPRTDTWSQGATYEVFGTRRL